MLFLCSVAELPFAQIRRLGEIMRKGARLSDMGRYIGHNLILNGVIYQAAMRIGRGGSRVHSQMSTRTSSSKISMVHNPHPVCKVQQAFAFGCGS
jgi:hypothetical protein